MPQSPDLIGGETADEQPKDSKALLQKLPHVSH